MKAGALRVEDRAAPFFERSLMLADALWGAFAGLDIWPAGVLADAAPNHFRVRLITRFVRRRRVEWFSYPF